jgi:hypothetical protein
MPPGKTSQLFLASPAGFNAAVRVAGEKNSYPGILIGTGNRRRREEGQQNDEKREEKITFHAVHCGYYYKVRNF